MRKQDLILAIMQGETQRNGGIVGEAVLERLPDGGDVSRFGRAPQVGECTACNPERYASYRRDGGGGRMLHYIKL